MVESRSYPVARNEKNRIVLPAEHVLVLVGGTVDPGNLWADENAEPGTTVHSRGYSVPGERARDPSYWARDFEKLGDAHDQNWYWQDNGALREQLFSGSFDLIQSRHLERSTRRG